MPVAGRYLIEQDCKDRLSAQVWQLICDDNSDGTADVTPAQRLINDAESYVEGRLGPMYSLAVTRLQGTAVCNEVKRLSLDAVQIRAAQRWPSYYRYDWVTMDQLIRRDLKDLREQIAQLDTEVAPEPATNTIGWVESGDDVETDPVEATFLGPGAMGVF